MSLERLAATQAGNLTTRQLRSQLTAAELETRIRHGTLIRRFRGVYALGHVPASRFSLALAAWLAHGPAAAPSHRDCAAAFGVLPEPDGPVHLSRPGGGRSLPGTVLHDADVAGALWPRHGLFVTSPARLMLDLAATEPRAVVERAWNEAQVLRLVTPHQLAEALAGWEGRRGVRILRTLLDDRGVTRSVLEDLLRRLIRSAALDEPEFNVWIDGVYADAVWRDRRVVVEPTAAPSTATTAPSRPTAARPTRCSCAAGSSCASPTAACATSPKPSSPRCGAR